MLTVLGICEQALYDIGITPPASLTSTTDPTQLQLKNILYAQARAMRSARIFPQQKRRHTFVLKAGRARYPFPQDFYAMCGDTAYDASEQLRVGGPLTDSAYGMRVYEYELTGTPYSMRISGLDFNSATGGGQFELNPPPESSGAVITFEYLTSTLFLPPHWAALTAYTNTAPDRVNANGFIYSCATNGTSGTIPPNFYTNGDGIGIGRDNSVEWAFVPAHPAAATSFFNVGDYVSANSKVYKCTVSGLCSATAPSHTSGTATDGTVTWEWMATPSAWAGGTDYTEDTDYVSANSRFYRCVRTGKSGTTSPNFSATAWGEKGATNAPIWTYQAGPYEAINATTDLCIFDDDCMVAGVRYRYQRSKTLPYDADPVTGESLEYKRLVTRAAGRWNGSYVGSSSRVMRGGGPSYYVPTRGQIQ